MTPEIRVLLVDDDEDMRATLADFIGRMGVGIRSAARLREAEQVIRSEAEPFDIILTDLRLPDGSGLDVLKAARTRSADSLVTIVTGFASLETAIEAIRLGAHDYMTKPFGLDEIGVQLRNMIQHVTLRKENHRLSVRLQELYREVNRLQGERSDVGALLIEIRDGVAENGRLLGYLAAHRRGLEPAPEKPAFSNLVAELERLDRTRGAVPLSHVEVEDRKRDLIRDFVDELS